MFNGYVDLSIDKMDVRLEEKPAVSRPDILAPKVPIVTVVGCISRGAGGLDMLTRASVPKTSVIMHADEQEIAEARDTPLGLNRYRLIGAADFRSSDELMSLGQRALFTRAATANVTRSLQDGRKLAVKGLLILGSPEARLNVLSAQSIADTCK
jgi:hypothetical protein